MLAFILEMFIWWLPHKYLFKIHKRTGNSSSNLNCEYKKHENFRRNLNGTIITGIFVFLKFQKFRNMYIMPLKSIYHT